MIKKITALILTIAICMSFGVAANAAEQNVDATSSATRLVSVFQDLADQWESNRTIATTKTLYDFAGNTYTLAEFYPTGYMIFNNEAALMMESAENSPSPYAGVTDNLYYAGPTHYYVYSAEKAQYAHSILNTVMTADQVSERTLVCANAQIEMNKIADSELKSYISGSVASARSAPTRASDGYTYVDNNEDFWTNLTTHDLMGYYETDSGDGCCSYVAAGLLLLYYDYYRNDDFIDDATYLSSTGNSFDGEDFAKHLYLDIGVALLNYDNAINATQTAKVMQRYLSEDCDITLTYWSKNMPTKANVVAQLQLQRPVIYGDRWNNPKPVGGTVDHSIVIYGYDSGNNLVAHFGWTDYTHVECSSPALALFISSACSIASYS